LELISEFAKILSFAFRLFGNIFAGQVLLFVFAFLLPLAVSAVYGLEFLVGAIQAAVFALLTLTFMANAVTEHHDDEH
jgi:F-type H+-transporting ATPase subunit a